MNFDFKPYNKYNRFVFYHGDDLDGLCSAAIIWLKFIQQTSSTYLIPVDYSNSLSEFMHFITPKDHVYILDYSFSPFTDMLKLNDYCKNMIWIDHHMTSMVHYMKRTFLRRYYKYTKREIKGSRPAFEQSGYKHHPRTKLSACELTWKWAFKDKKPLPYAVYLLGRYDVWDHENENVVNFQLGFQTEDADPRNHFALWKQMFRESVKSDKIAEYIEKGKVINKYLTEHRKEFNKTFFECQIKGYNAIVINETKGNLYSFNQIPDIDKYDVKVIFYRIKDYWKYSIYSKKVNMAKLAAKFGGGGHREAAGFQSSKNIFDEAVDNQNLGIILNRKEGSKIEDKIQERQKMDYE